MLATLPQAAWQVKSDNICDPSLKELTHYYRENNFSYAVHLNTSSNNNKPFNYFKFRAIVLAYSRFSRRERALIWL